MSNLNTDWTRRVGTSLLLLACIACQDASNREETSTQPSDAAKENSEAWTGVTTSTYTTESRKAFTVTSKPFSASLAEVTVETEGFEFDAVYELGALDPIEKVFLADLDKDGFQELYTTTRSAGSGSASSIFGVASNKDRSTSRINVPELERGERLEGFMGHNRFTLESGGLVESYPVYAKGDSNARPSGGERRLRYSLIKGEAGWILKPVE